MGTIRVTRKEFAAGVAVPAGEFTVIELLPPAECCAVLGAAFDTNKAFPLPQCLPALRTVYEAAIRRSPAAVLLVGHTDPSGEPDINTPLSLQRAQIAEAWLKDDVDAWLVKYESSVAEKQRWGAREDQLLLRSMTGFDQREPAESSASNNGNTSASGNSNTSSSRPSSKAKNDGLEDPARWFQRTRGLEVDGIVGPKTRRALITEYFALARGEAPPSAEGASESSTTATATAPKPELTTKAHGAGENFPLASVAEFRARLKPVKPPAKSATAAETSEPADEDEPLDRRMEFYLFPQAEGIQPPPGKPDGPEYFEWVRLATVRKDLRIEDTRIRLPLVEFADVLFNTNGAIPLPISPVAEATLVTTQTEDADEDDNTPTPLDAEPTFISLAKALVQAYTHPEQTLHVAGHADTTADASVNDPLSAKRARAVLAVLVGDREDFKTVGKDGSTLEDQDAVLLWASERFGFGCSLAEHRNDRVKAIKAFQTSYNDSAQRAQTAQELLDVDGDFGPLTWGAVFDLYEARLSDVLDGDEGEGNRELLAEYRKSVRFADEENKFKGYGERYPLVHKRKNNFKSQKNRRVEVVFFDQGEAPDLSGGPDASQLYDEAIFVRVPLSDTGFEALPIRYALLPTQFGNGRTFPKPSCLPLLRRVANSALKAPSLRLVIVGHTDHTVKDDNNEKLSLARAEAVKALLCHDVDFFLTRFDTADPIKTWNFEEVQWMLHALSSKAGPHYVGEADGYPGSATLRALGLYQLTRPELTPDNGCDADTLKQLILDYQALIPAPVEKERVEVVAAGSWTPPKPPEAPGESPPDDVAATDESADDSNGADDNSSGSGTSGTGDTSGAGDDVAPAINRRVEVFLFERPVVPKADTVDPSTRRASPTYRAWERRSKREPAANVIPFAIRLTNHNLAPIASASFELQRYDREADAFNKVSNGSLDRSGNATLEVEPGTYHLVFELESGTHTFGTLISTDVSAGFAAIIAEPLKPLFTAG